MKHTTKPVPRASKTVKNRMIGLRLDAAFMSEMEQLANTEQRSLADMARICVRMGMQEIKAKAAGASGK